MARAYITEKQVGREFWYFAVIHSASMINQIPGWLGRKITTPFEAVHNKTPDSKTWFELFSVGYFDHTTNGAEKRSKTEDQTLYGIAVGRDDKSNTIVFYNPLTKSYYRPPAFRLDEGHLPVTNFPSPFNTMVASRLVSTGIDWTQAQNRSQQAHESISSSTGQSLEAPSAMCPWY